jgi:hypothetical protein
MADFVYYKKNVDYVVGGRFNSRDSIGFTLTPHQPWVAVPIEGLRDFKMVNKNSLIEGLIIPADEPTLEWETDNAISDEQALELVKGNFLTLKKTLEKISSAAIVAKMLDLAKETDRPKKTVAAIEARLAELQEDENFVTPEMMRGVQ